MENVIKLWRDMTRAGKDSVTCEYSIFECWEGVLMRFVGIMIVVH
jgi:hypothetical protein